MPDVSNEVVITDNVTISSDLKQSEFVCKECNAKYKKEVFFFFVVWSLVTEKGSVCT